MEEIGITNSVYKSIVKEVDPEAHDYHEEAVIGRTDGLHCSICAEWHEELQSDEAEDIRSLKLSKCKMKPEKVDLDYDWSSGE